MRHTKSFQLVGAIALAALVLVPAASFAGGEIFDDTFSGCGTANCSSLRIPATVLSISPSAAAWTADVFAGPGECLRLDVGVMAASPIDLEIVAVAPNGTVFRNDDRNGATDRRPLVKIASTPNNGWYTVHIAQFSGSAVNTNFVLFYGRYPAGNPNCSSPTSPVLSATGNKAVETDGAAQAQAPGSAQ